MESVLLLNGVVPNCNYKDRYAVSVTEFAANCTMQAVPAPPLSHREKQFLQFYKSKNIVSKKN